MLFILIFCKTSFVTILGYDIFLFSKGYRLIKDNSLCIHSNGKPLTSCYKHKAVDCAADCTGFNWCIGYEIQTTTNHLCHLIPSSLYINTCPNGFYEYNKNNLAVTSDDLVASPASTYACYAKIKGIMKLILFNHYSYFYIWLVYPDRCI